MRGKTKVVESGGVDDDKDVPRDERDEIVTSSEGLRCDTCKQAPTDMDRHTNFTRLTKWRAVNTNKKGQKVCSGHECYACFAIRRKLRKGKTQTDVIDEMEDPAIAEELEEARRKYVSGEEKHKRLEHGAVKTKVKTNEGNFEEEAAVGHFYGLPEYCNKLEPGDYSAWAPKRMCRFIREREHDADIVKDRLGNWGVRISSLPKGAMYEFRMGAYQRDGFEKVATFSDSDDARDAAAEVMEEKPAVGEDGEDLSDDEKTPFNTGAKSEVVARRSRARSPPRQPSPPALAEPIRSGGGARSPASPTACTRRRVAFLVACLHRRLLSPALPERALARLGM